MLTNIRGGGPSPKHPPTRCATPVYKNYRRALNIVLLYFIPSLPMVPMVFRSGRWVGAAFHNRKCQKCAKQFDWKLFNVTRWVFTIIVVECFAIVCLILKKIRQFFFSWGNFFQNGFKWLQNLQMTGRMACAALARFWRIESSSAMHSNYAGGCISPVSARLILSVLKD